MTKKSDTRKKKDSIEKEIEASTIIHIQDQKENWSECTLEDGTILRVRPVITEVRKLNQKGIDGQPAYVVKSALITDVRHPSKSKAKAKR